MKILQIISSGGMYGAESVILNLSRTLNDGVHRSVLGVFSNASNPNLQLHEVAIRQGIESHLIPCIGKIDRTAIANIRALVSQTQTDLVHAHGYKADSYVLLALGGMGIPLVSTCHSWHDEDLPAYLYGVVDRFVLRRYSRVVGVSNEVKDRLLAAGVREERVAVIRNGIDLRPFYDAQPVLRLEQGQHHSKIIGLVGRLSKEKGVDIFLRAAALILKESPGVEFVVVGEGPARNDLLELISQLNIGDRVKLLGHRGDMPSIYASLDIMVSSSRGEGLPIAILEGMASGLPLIATPVGEVPSLIRDGITGVLLPTGDSVTLAAAMVGLLRDCDRRKRLGAAARQLVKDRFSAERMTADYLRVYRDAVGAGAVGG